MEVFRVLVTLQNDSTILHDCYKANKTNDWLPISLLAGTAAVASVAAVSLKKYKSSLGENRKPLIPIKHKELSLQELLNTKNNEIQKLQELLNTRDSNIQTLQQDLDNCVSEATISKISEGQEVSSSSLETSYPSISAPPLPSSSEPPSPTLVTCSATEAALQKCQEILDRLKLTLETRDKDVLEIQAKFIIENQHKSICEGKMAEIKTKTDHDITGLQTELDTIRSTLITERNISQQCIKTNKGLQKQITEVKQTLATYEAAETKTTDRIHKLVQDAKQLSSKNDNLKQDNKACEDELCDLNKRLTSLQSKLRNSPPTGKR